MKRVAQTVRLRPEHREEYLRLHSAVWPGVEAALLRANIRNYSIYLHGDVLFAYMEYTGDDFEADMASIEAHPETQRWEAHRPVPGALPRPGRLPPVDGAPRDLAPQPARRRHRLTRSAPARPDLDDP